jgi:hypothetical protein
VPFPRPYFRIKSPLLEAIYDGEGHIMEWILGILGRGNVRVRACVYHAVEADREDLLRFWLLQVPTDDEDDCARSQHLQAAIDNAQEWWRLRLSLLLQQKAFLLELTPPRKKRRRFE